MCGIAGVYSKKSENVVPVVSTLLSCLTKRGPDGADIDARGKIIQSHSLPSLHYSKISCSAVLGHTKTCNSKRQLREQPFLDPRVIKTALQTDLRLNINGESDNFGKLVHREAFYSHGIPSDIASRVKEAAQHGSGVHRAFDSIARMHAYDESIITSTYLESIKVREKLGSSQKYGFLFDEQKIWDAEPHVQM